ncbi:LysM peptidoglycan-binding domain-containing protein [Flagellimonas allohymeniacidonis]|nr:LysM domain-containing protein [Allomuricauda hymeniacidonis]
MIFFVLWVCFFNYSWGQQNSYTVIAESGDGIYSILRKQGVDPVKYYQAFIELNEENIKDGSFLYVGREYQIPFAPDSFKNKAIRVTLPEEVEEPIFESGLNALNRKSNRLGNAVYYLITETSDSSGDRFTKQIGVNLARELMVHGATVFILEDKREKHPKENEEVLADQNGMGVFVDAVNKRFLKHSGKYQRLLVIRSNGTIQNGKINVAVYHHEKSKEGQRLAANIEEIFKQHGANNKRFKDVQTVLEDKNSLYLAKNVLPAISLLDITGSSQSSNPKEIQVSSNRNAFARWLTNGIMKDYADLDFEDQD